MATADPCVNALNLQLRRESVFWERLLRDHTTLAPDVIGVVVDYWLDDTVHAFDKMASHEWICAIVVGVFPVSGAVRIHFATWSSKWDCDIRSACEISPFDVRRQRREQSYRRDWFCACVLCSVHLVRCEVCRRDTKGARPWDLFDRRVV